MIYDYLVSLVGDAPPGMEWLLYLASVYVVIGLLTIVTGAIVSVFRFPWRASR